MIGMRTRAARTGRSQLGVTIVEVAIVVPLFFLLVFGAIDWGLTRQHQHAVTNGVREGTRRAVVAEWGTDSSCTGASAWVGTLRVICATKDEIGEGSVTVFVRVPNGYAVGEPVTVCAQRPTSPVTGVVGQFLAGATLRSHTTMRIEELGFGGMNTGGESGDWSWCA